MTYHIIKTNIVCVEGQRFGRALGARPERHTLFGDEVCWQTVQKLLDFVDIL